MRNRFALTLTAVSSVLVPAVAAPAPASARSKGDRLQNIAVKHINGFRARHSVNRMRRSRILKRSASAYASYMMSTGYFGHLSTIRASRRYRSLGEIILMHRGGHGRPRVAVKNWALSAGHRQVMLDPGYRLMGVGMASGRFQGHRTTIWVTHVGRR